MSQRHLNSGQIHTHYLRVVVLASMYILMRSLGADPEEAAFFAILAGSALRPHQQAQPSL